mgnify:FL=1
MIPYGNRLRPEPTRPPRPVHLTCDRQGRLQADGVPLFTRASPAVALFLALLWKAAERDREESRRKYPGATPRLKLLNYSQIVALAPKGSASEGTVANWMNRLKQGVEGATGDLMLGDLLVSDGTGMVRLADTVTCEGFDIAALTPRRGAA